MLCVCQTLIKALLTYLLISNPGIGNFSIPDPGIEPIPDPGIEKTVPGLQTLVMIADSILSPDFRKIL